MLNGYPVYLRQCCLSESPCRKYRTHMDGDNLRMHYVNKAGQLCAAKVKTKDKDFWMEGNNTDHQLFGQNLITTKGSRLTIYEGALGAEYGYEAQPKWPHVSIPH